MKPQDTRKDDEDSSIFRSSNLVGDLFCPLIFFLKLFGHTALSYVQIQPEAGAQNGREEDRPRSRSSRIGIAGKDLNSNASNLLSVSVLNYETPAVKQFLGQIDSSESEECGASRRNCLKYEYKIVWRSFFTLWSLALALVYFWTWSSILYSSQTGEKKDDA